MARQIKTDIFTEVGFILASVMTDGTTHSEHFHVGDTITDFKYVENGEVRKVSGKLIDIDYTLNSGFNKGATINSNIFGDIYKLNTVTLDCSALYDSKIITVDVSEIIGHDVNETNVKKMVIAGECILSSTVTLSDETSTSINQLHEGDTINGLRYLNPVAEEDDIIGNFKVVNFVYKLNGGESFDIASIKIKNVDTEVEVVIPLLAIKSFANTSVPNTPPVVDNNIEDGGETIIDGDGPVDDEL